MTISLFGRGRFTNSVDRAIFDRESFGNRNANLALLFHDMFAYLGRN